MAAASKSGVIAGRAFVIIEALDGTADALRSVERTLMSWGSRLQSIGARIFARGLTAMVPAALGTNIYRQFDDIMRRVQARTQGSAVEMQALRDQAIGLGRDSAFSAREVASLQDVLAQRKFDRTQIREMTPSILMLGRAAGSGDNPAQDLLNAADLVSQAIMMYELEAKDAARVSDIFTAAANESNFALEDLIISMANGGPVAHQYGLALEETLAIMMVMRDLSIDSSVAGTGLRNLFLKASDKKAVDDFNKLMLEMTGNTLKFEDEMGNLFDPASILFSFDRLTKELGTAQRGHLLAELFGLRAITPATAVAANAKNFTDALAAVRNSAGETERAYETMEGGIGGVFRRLWNIIEGLGMAFGEALERPVIAIGNRLHSLIMQFIGWATLNEEIIVGVSLLTAAVVSLGAAMFVLGSALKIVAFVLSPIRMIIGVLISSIRLLIVAAIVPAAKAIWTLITSVISMSVSMITTAVPAVWSFLMSLITMASAALSFVVPAILALGIAVVQLAATLIALAPELVLVFLAITPLLVMAFALMTRVDEKAQDINESIRQTGETAIEATGFWEGLLGTLSAAFDFVIVRMAEMGNSVIATLRGITQAMMAGDLNLAWQIAITGMKLIWSQFLDFFWDGWYNVVQRLKAEWIGFQQWLLEMDTKWNPFADALANLEKFNDLNAELRKTRVGNQGDVDNWKRETDIEFYRQQLGLLTDMAARRKTILDELDFNLMNNPALMNAPIGGAIKDLIENGANTGLGGAKAIESARFYTMEGAKQAYENAQNRTEQLQNQELKRLDLILQEANEMNGHLNDIKNKPVGHEGV